MLKFRVTNISEDPRFLVEAGKLLQPGQSVAVNRLDPGTRAETRIWGVEESAGGFPAPGLPTLKQGPVNFDDDDDVPAKKPVVESGPGKLVTATRRKKSVPMVAAGGDEPTNPSRKPKEEVLRSSAADDDEELERLTRPAVAASELRSETPDDRDEGGFVDRGRLPSDDR